MTYPFLDVLDYITLARHSRGFIRYHRRRPYAPDETGGQTTGLTGPVAPDLGSVLVKGGSGSRLEVPARVSS
jgi:hypothetical protein